MSTTIPQLFVALQLSSVILAGPPSKIQPARPQSYLDGTEHGGSGVAAVAERSCPPKIYGGGPALVGQRSCFAQNCP